MTGERATASDRLHRLVDAVLDVPLEQRERAIAALCCGNVELEQTVRRALAPDEHERLQQSLAEANASTASIAATGPTISVLGPYRLLERLGEGAFGEVYVAEQTEPVRRRVAIKVLKAGMGSRQTIGRFEAERQALASMDHPNIAKVFDAGTTPLGLPYFVMELVRGQPITSFCTAHRLGLRDRLSLFISVCEAVQHAHQRGFIHRDIKPGNVLVTVVDGKAVPKVIDFGIAKAIGPTLTDATLCTQFRQFIGTPAYMSPEQMALSAVDVDTRSDVYSLGALLYELVSGVTPFDEETLLKAGLDELRRVVRETDPPMPSRRVGSGDAAWRVALASSMQVPADRLANQLRGEVDWIVIKATDRDRSRRYQSPAELATDIAAHLAGNAVSAGPRNRVYLARKFARRHRVPLSIASALVLGLVATTIGTGIGLSREAAARNAAVKSELIARDNEDAAKLSEQAAQSERLKAEELARDASDSLELLTSLISTADPAQVGGKKDMTVGEMLDRLVSRLDDAEAGKGPPLQPRVMMRLRSDAAGVYYWQGRIDEGRVQAAKGLALAESFYGPDSLEAAKAITLVVSGFWFGRGPTTEGELLARRRLDILTTHGQGNDIEAIDALHGLNLMLHAQGRAVECGQICRDLIRRYEAMESPPVVGYATAHADLALSELARGRSEEALQLIQASIRMHEEKLDEQTRQRYISRSYATKASVLLAMGRLEEAERAARTSISISDAARGPEHPYPMYERRVLISVLTKRGKLAETRTLIDTYERIHAASGGAPGLTELSLRAMLLRRAGQHDEALALWENARATLVQMRAAEVHSAPTSSSIGPVEIAEGFAERLGVLTDLGRPRDGLADAEAAWTDMRAFFAKSGDDRASNWRLRTVAAELLRAYEAIDDEPSRKAASVLREQRPDLLAAPGFGREPTLR